MSEDIDAQAQLSRADELASRSRAVASRWYVRYLIAYGIASFGLAATYGFVDRTVLATAITMPLWVIIIVGLSVWSRRQGTAIRGFGAIHGAVIAVWGIAWAATIGFGTTVFSGSWQWFVGGGLVMAAAAFAGAYLTYHRNKA